MDHLKLDELIELAKQKNDLAFSELYQRYHKQIYRYVLKLCQGNEQDAKEITQDTFLNAWKYIHQLKLPNYFPLWIKRIARNRATRTFQKNRDILVDPSKLRESDYVESKIDFIPSKSLDDMTDQEIVHMLLQELSIQHREILELYYFKQLSIKEIKGLLHIPEGTIKSRIFQARKKLKIKIETFEQVENRKISFHLDFVMPSVLILFLWKLKDWKQPMKLVQIGSISIACITGTILWKESIKQNPFKNQSIGYVQNYKEPIIFTPLNYKNIYIQTPLQAYYAIQKEFPNCQDILQLTKDELQILAPLVFSLQKSNTNYWITLVESGWANTFFNRYSTIKNHLNTQ